MTGRDRLGEAASAVLVFSGLCAFLCAVVLGIAGAPVVLTSVASVACGVGAAAGLAAYDAVVGRSWAAGWELFRDVASTAWGLAPHVVLRRRRCERRCPHPEHRLRHIHGDERLYGWVAECMECRHLFKDWPGGAHDDTLCRTFNGLLS